MLVLTCANRMLVSFPCVVAPGSSRKTETLKTMLVFFRNWYKKIYSPKYEQLCWYCIQEVLFYFCKFFMRFKVNAELVFITQECIRLFLFYRRQPPPPLNWELDKTEHQLTSPRQYEKFPPRYFYQINGKGPWLNRIFLVIL